MVTLINPNVVVQRDDMFTTGIIYMPLGLAYFAAALGAEGFDIEVIDAFGEQPNQCRISGDFLIRGLSASEVAEKVSFSTEAVVLYAIGASSHNALIEIIRKIRERLADVTIIVMENSQAVTAYSLRKVQDELYSEGVEYIITGEPEQRGVKLLKAIKENAKEDDIANIDGIGFKSNNNTHYSEPKSNIENLDELNFPAWELFPLDNYWRLRYAHGPFETKKYLPLLTSRGCPYSCTFCVSPEVTSSKWRGRSAKNIVDEIEYYTNTFGVREFHIEDLNPTVDEQRIIDLCNEIKKRRLDIIWKIVSGTKAETIRSKDTIRLMHDAGCRYISISPESGSARVLKMLNKSFDVKHALGLLKEMNKNNMRSQACFVLGYPGETDQDRKKTKEMVECFAKAGIDEIALFIVAPLPGAEVFAKMTGYDDYSQLTFSPRWRKDYNELFDFRFKLYRSFIFWKLRYHPIKILKQPFNFMLRRFKTKMEMVPYRAFHTMLLTKTIKRKGGNYED